MDFPRCKGTAAVGHDIRYVRLQAGYILFYLIIYDYLCSMEFKIRQYGRTELAQIYFPDIASESAWKKLRRYMEHHPSLMGDLCMAGYDAAQQRFFTPLQVKIIADAIGAPDE